MLEMSVPWWEFVLRGVVVYAFLLVFLRVTGRRKIGQYEPFDLVLLLILSNAVQNAMNAGDNSLAGGLLSAATLILCHSLIARLTYHVPRIARWVDGRPRVLVHDGKVDDAALAARLTEFYGDPPTRRVVRGILVDRRRDHPGEIADSTGNVRELRTAAAKARAERALARLAAGDAFADVARAFSDHESAERGGLLEPYRPTTFGGSVDATIAGFTKSGERSGVLETRVGYVIVELVSVEPATLPKFRDELVRLVMEEGILPDERETARRKLLAQVTVTPVPPR